MALTDDERATLATLTAKAAEPDQAPAETAAEVAAEVAAQTVATIGEVAAVVAEVVGQAEATASARVEDAHRQAEAEVTEANELAELALGVATVVAEQAAEVVELAEAAPPLEDGETLEDDAGAEPGESTTGGASHDLAELLTPDAPTSDPEPEGSSSSPRGHWYFRKRRKARA